MTAPARSRLPLLVLMLAGVVALRWWDPVADKVSADVAPAVVRATTVAAPTSLSRGTESPARPMAGDLNGDTRAPEDGDLRDLFAVRTPPAPPPAPPAPPAPRPPKVEVAAAPPLPPASAIDVGPPPPLLQVIGTWKDERGPSVFVVGPQGVVQARAGDTLLSQYTVTEVRPQQLVLRHLPSNRELSLPVSAAAAVLPRPNP